MLAMGTDLAVRHFSEVSVRTNTDNTEDVTMTKTRTAIAAKSISTPVKGTKTRRTVQPARKAAPVQDVMKAVQKRRGRAKTSSLGGHIQQFCYAILTADPFKSYKAVAAQIRQMVPGSNTTDKSVAAMVSRLRAEGFPVKGRAAIPH